jgi:hypothetical protein
VSRDVLLLQGVPEDTLEETQEGVLQDGGVMSAFSFSCDDDGRDATTTFRTVSLS